MNSLQIMSFFHNITFENILFCFANNLPNRRYALVAYLSVEKVSSSTSTYYIKYRQLVSVSNKPSSLP